MDRKQKGKKERKKRNKKERKKKKEEREKREWNKSFPFCDETLHLSIQSKNG